MDNSGELNEERASLLYAEYLETKEFATLEEAIEILRNLIENTEKDEVDNVGRLSFLFACCLRARFERGKDPKEIANAIMFAEISIENIPDLFERDKCVLKAERQGLLWRCLISQDESLSCKDPDAFTKAFRLAKQIEQSLTDQRVSGQPRTDSLRRLGHSYQLRWDKTAVFSDLAESLRLGEEALSSLTEASRPDARNDLSSDMALRLLRASMCYDGDETAQMGNSVPLLASAGSISVVHLRESFELDKDRPLKRIENIMEFTSNLGLLPRGQRGPILGEISDLLRQCILHYDDSMQTSLEFDLQAHASSADGLPRLAAAAALENGESICTAIRLLEKGRGLIKSILFEETAVRNMKLRLNIPTELGAQYIEAWRNLRSSVSNEEPFEKRRELLTRLRAAEAAMHSAMGLDRFTDDMSDQTILSTATDRPIALLNLTSVRSDAIIITKEGYSTVPLPDLNEEEMIGLSWEVQWRLAQERESHHSEAHKHLVCILKKLWKSVVKPVLVHLKYKQQTGPLGTWHEICWIPTGVLSLYPLHAAGMGLQGKANAINHVISTYAPSLKSLIFARRAVACRSRRPPQESAPLAAVLAMSTTHGLEPEDIWEDPNEIPERRHWIELKYSREEAALVHHAFPKHESVNINKFEPPTREAVAVLNMGVPIVHLSCHGYINYIYPSKSMLLFSDWATDPLNVPVIDKLKIKSELAVLSACFSANSGVDNLQDESIQLTSSMFDAGFPRVIGSLWEISQVKTRDFVEQFYEYLGQHYQGAIGTRVVAEASHAASLAVGQRSVNDANLVGEPIDWSAFICMAV